jgi:uncharacterized protein (DUF2236 family)
MTLAQTINAERMLVLAWPRAILLQLAHPLVAAGVAEHSSFRASPMAAVLRLHETIKAMLRLTYADEPGRARTIATIRGIHRRVHGHLAEATGPFAAGTPYSAEDPELLLWVHATLLESVLDGYEQLVSPLGNGVRDRYCAEAAPVAIDLGVPAADVPRTGTALEALLAMMYASGKIVVGADARRVANAVLAPPIGVWARPLVRVNRRLTVGWLPAGIRDQYGWPWIEADEMAHARLISRLRSVRRRLPDALALWPEARSIRQEPAVATRRAPRKSARNAR